MATSSNSAGATRSLRKVDAARGTAQLRPVDDFTREVGEAFDEVASKGMPVRFLLSSDRHKGVVLSTASFAHLREPGYEGEDQIIVYCPRSQFARPPADENARETINVLEGANSGEWTVIAVNSDVAHHIFTCVPKD